MVRLPPLELVLGPGGEPLVAWPTSTPPAPVDAFDIPKHLLRKSKWRVLADYCIDPDGCVVSAGVSYPAAEVRLRRQIHGWTFTPWSSEHGVRFCETAMVYDNDELRGRYDASTMIVFVPIVPPVPELPPDGSLEHVPARAVHDPAVDSRWGYSTIPQDTWLGPVELEPGFGVITFDLCVDSEGVPSYRHTDLDLEWLAPKQRIWVLGQLSHHYRMPEFSPRFEAGVPVEDCDVEVRYGVWVVNDLLLSYHGQLDELLDRLHQGLAYRVEPDAVIPWADHGPIESAGGGPSPRVIAARSWIPPYELATTMPASMPTRSVRVRFCAPAAGGRPTEVRVLDSDAVGAERAVLRLVAEGVARWPSEPTAGVEETTLCGEVEWQIGRRATELSGAEL